MGLESTQEINYREIQQDMTELNETEIVTEVITGKMSRKMTPNLNRKPIKSMEKKTRILAGECRRLITR